MEIAFIFPGQGSQYTGMGKELYHSYAAVRKLFEEADEILGFSLTNLCFNGPDDELQKTVNAQPAIYAVSVACAHILQENGINPSAAAGHSLGEYSAFTVSGAITFSDGIKLVRKRGQFMQEAVPLGRGGMAAILGLDNAILEHICREVSYSEGIVEIANLNCPGQVVISGEIKALQRASLLAKEAGAKRCVSLPVSAPFHSNLMCPAGEKMALELAAVTVREPMMPVVANVTADYVNNSREICNLLVRQISSPVRWEESIGRLLKDGFNTFVEAGPGSVLTGLLRKINRKSSTVNVENLASLEKVIALLKEVS